jgi:hypothetical protein
MTSSLFRVTNDSGSSMIISGRSGSDGAPDRLAYSEITDSSNVDVDSKSLEMASGFDLNLIHP